MAWLKLSIVVTAGLVLAMLAFPFGQTWIEVAGHHLPKGNVVVDYAWGVAWALLLGSTLLLWPVSLRVKRQLIWLWTLKCVVALGLMLVYEWNYGLDAFSYFWLGQPGLYDDNGLAFGQGTEIMRAISNLHWRYLIADSYHAMKLTFAYVGFIGAYFFYRGTALAFGRDDLRLLWLLVCIPSVLQWSSILGKDPIVFCGIGIYAYGVVRFQRKEAPSALFYALLGGVLAAATRPWLALILVAPLLSFIWLRVKRPAVKLALPFVAAAAIFFALGFFSDRLQVASIDDAVTRTELLSQGFSTGGSANTSALSEQNSLEKMIAFAPVGAFTALYRPLPGEVLNVFGVLAGLENLALLWLTALAFKRGRARDLQEPLVLWALTLVLVWAFVYGFVSFHNMGGGARFRLQIMPVFVCLLLYLGRVLQRFSHAEELRRRVRHRADPEPRAHADRAPGGVESGSALPPGR
jgi:hypothetical protein